MKRKLLGFLLLCILLSGCTTTSNRIYTVCKEDNGVLYCYNNSGEYYCVTDGSRVRTKGIGMKELPALVLNPKPGSYEFVQQLPGLYKGTLESVNHYVYTLTLGNSSSIDVVYRDWNSLEFYVKSETFNARIIFNIRGDVRMYFVDKDGRSIEPVQLTDES